MRGERAGIVRDYLLRGLLRPVAYTTGGYGLSMTPRCNGCALRAAFEAGIGLDALARLCRALDAADGDGASAQLAVLRQLVASARGPGQPRNATAAMPTNRHSTRRVCQNSPEHLPSETHKPITGYLWARRQCSPVPPSADSRHCCGSALKTESMVTPVFNTDFDDKLACLNLSGV
jgi:MerR family mercuric resistance operon transcriptional regulator